MRPTRTKPYLPLTTHCSLLTAHCSLLTTHHLLLTTHHILLATHYYSLLTTRYQAWIACDKNEALAANLLFDGMGDD